MLPKDLNIQTIEKLKETAQAYPAGSVPSDFDPNNFVFHSNTGLTLMLTIDSSSGSPYWHMSMSYARRAPTEEEAQEILTAFFANGSNAAGRLIKPAGSSENVVHYRVPVQ